MKTKVLKKEKKVKQIKMDKIFPVAGYKKNPVTNSIEINEKIATEIRSLFDLLAYGTPLSDENIMHLIFIFAMDGFVDVLSTILNPFYCGFIERNGNYYQGTHTPLIDTMTWKVANDNLKNIFTRVLAIMEKINNDKH